MRIVLVGCLLACNGHDAPGPPASAPEAIEPRPVPAKPTQLAFAGAAPSPGPAVTTVAGWTVTTSEATLVARAPNDPQPHLLAEDLAHPSPMIGAGGWACLTTLPGAKRIVHCVDPVRRLHVTSQPLPAAVTLAGIELVPKPRLVLHGPEGDLALPLP